MSSKIIRAQQFTSNKGAKNLLINLKCQAFKVLFSKFKSRAKKKKSIDEPKRFTNTKV